LKGLLRGRRKKGEKENIAVSNCRKKKKGEGCLRKSVKSYGGYWRGEKGGSSSGNDCFRKKKTNPK